jgi:hypothetical protein
MYTHFLVKEVSIASACVSSSTDSGTPAYAQFQQTLWRHIVDYGFLCHWSIIAFFFSLEAGIGKANLVRSQQHHDNYPPSHLSICIKSFYLVSS